MCQYYLVILPSVCNLLGRQEKVAGVGDTDVACMTTLMVPW